MKKMLPKIALMALIAAVTITNVKGYASETIEAPIVLKSNTNFNQRFTEHTEFANGNTLGLVYILFPQEVKAAKEFTGCGWLVYALQGLKYATQIIAAPRVAATETVNMSKLD